MKPPNRSPNALTFVGTINADAGVDLLREIVLVMQQVQHETGVHYRVWNVLE